MISGIFDHKEILTLIKYIIIMKKMYVYILTNYNNTTLYIGVTNNLIRRTFEHKSNTAESFSQKYHLNKLVYYEIYDDEITAITREKYLKKAYKKTKIKLISEANPNWIDLYNSITE